MAKQEYAVTFVWRAVPPWVPGILPSQLVIVSVEL